MLVVLAALLVGSIGGSLVGIERRLEALAGRIQRRTVGAGDPGPAGHAVRERFVEGWLTASLLFCIGPLAVLGALADGLGRGIEQLTLKSVLDGFAALAFASSFGVGVLFSAVSVAAVEGGLTLIGVLLGSVLPDAHIAALTATGGLLLVGVGIRLLGIREIPVGDMLPAVFLAPAITQLVVVVRTSPAGAGHRNSASTVGAALIGRAALTDRRVRRAARPRASGPGIRPSRPSWRRVGRR